MTESIDLESSLSLKDIEFNNKDLSDWQDEFTINIPNGHITNQEMQKLLADLNNKYHLAYNCFNELLISYGQSKTRFEEKKSIVINEMTTTLRSEGAARLPAKEVIAEVAMARSDDLKELNKELMLFDIIKTFFENNKSKLERSMQVLINLSFLVNASDKVSQKIGDH